MSDVSHSTTVEKGVLIRLIAAARVSHEVTWPDAATEAAHDVASLWGDREPVAQLSHIQVSTEVLLQLAAAADAAIRTDYGADSVWAVQIERDLSEISKLVRMP